MENEVDKISQKIGKLLKKNNVVRAGVFGSYARREQKRGSDIDILVEVKGRKFSLLDLIGLEIELTKILKKKVDLLTYNGISPILRKRILAEEVRII